MICKIYFCALGGPGAKTRKKKLAAMCASSREDEVIFASALVFGHSTNPEQNERLLLLYLFCLLVRLRIILFRGKINGSFKKT